MGRERFFFHDDHYKRNLKKNNFFSIFKRFHLLNIKDCYEGNHHGNWLRDCSINKLKSVKFKKKVFENDKIKSYRKPLWPGPKKLGNWAAPKSLASGPPPPPKKNHAKKRKFPTWTRVQVRKLFLPIKKFSSCTWSSSQVFKDLDRGQAASSYGNS